MVREVITDKATLEQSCAGNVELNRRIEEGFSFSVVYMGGLWKDPT